MILFVQFFLQLLIDALVFLACGKERRYFDGAEGPEEAEPSGIEQPEERSIHILYLRYSKFNLLNVI